MSTEWRQDGFGFVIKAGEEVKISLGSDDEAPQIINIWMKDKDAAKALAIVVEKQAYFLGVWRGRHG